MNEKKREALTDQNRKDAAEFCEAFARLGVDPKPYADLIAELLDNATDRTITALPTAPATGALSKNLEVDELDKLLVKGIATPDDQCWAANWLRRLHGLPDDTTPLKSRNASPGLARDALELLDECAIYIPSKECKEYQAAIDTIAAALKSNTALARDEVIEALWCARPLLSGAKIVSNPFNVPEIEIHNAQVDEAIAKIDAALKSQPPAALPPDWKQDQAETTRIKPPAGARKP